MKIFKVAVITILSLLLFSCTTDDEESQQSDFPDQGNVSLALSNGAGFSLENIQATVTNQYNSGNIATITITGTSGQTGDVAITLVDDDPDFIAIASGQELPINGLSELSVFATVNYVSDNFTLNAGAGTFIINSYTENTEAGYSVLNGTFSAADSNFNTMTSSVLGLVLTCQNC